MKNRLFIIIFAVILIFSAAIIYFINRVSSGGTTAEIVQNGIVTETINLSDITEAHDFVVESPGGGTNTVHAENGAISITDANCPDKLCVKTGKITNETYPIVCLPHKLVVRITKTSDENPKQIDAISGIQ